MADHTLKIILVHASKCNTIIYIHVIVIKGDALNTIELKIVKNDTTFNFNLPFFLKDDMD